MIILYYLVKFNKIMKKMKLTIKDTYENVVEYIYKHYDILEPTEFTFTKIVNTNAKMRRRKEFKNVYYFEKDGVIVLNNNIHKRNLFKKVCLAPLGGEVTDFEKYGID